jgi:hypothetical protein
MCKQKYRMLFSPNHSRKPGPKGPSAELIHAVVEMKQRNPRWGCPQIAEQITLAFNLAIDKDVVRRILAHSLPYLSAKRCKLGAVRRALLLRATHVGLLSLFSAFQALDIDEAGFAGQLQFLNGAC